MKINSCVLICSGKISNIGEIQTTESNRKVVSVKVPCRIGIGNDIVSLMFEISFWNSDAETVSKLPIGTPITLTGVPYIKPFITNDGKPYVSIVVSAVLWDFSDSISAHITAPGTAKPSSPPPAMPKILEEVMTGGKYKGKRYIDIISKDREYLNALIMNDKTPENWKTKLIEVTKAYDNYMKSQHG